MATLTFQWDSGSPAQIEANTLAYIQKVEAAIKDIAGLIASRLQAHAQANAPWTDRTGVAREGLVTIADVSTELVTIYLVTTAPYGVFLELARGGKYAIIMPTIEALMPEIYALMQRVFQ